MVDEFNVGMDYNPRRMRNTPRASTGRPIQHRLVQKNPIPTRKPVPTIPAKTSGTPKGVLLCAIGKMENNYIREFVEHYKELGFKNICLYDNNDPEGERFEDVIGDYIDDGFVILENKRGAKLAQVPSYNECFRKYKRMYEWICFFDIDEFLVIEDKMNIDAFLSQPKFKSYNVVRVNWKQYTDSGHIGVKNGNYSVTRFTETLASAAAKKGSNIRYSDVIGSNIQAKSFVRTKTTNVSFSSPHCFLIREPACDATGKPCEEGIKIGPRPVFKGAWLNHYRFKTIEEYVMNKMVRLWPTSYGNGGKSMLNLNFFFKMNIKTPEKVQRAHELIAENKLKKPQILRVSGWFPKEEIHNWGDDLNLTFLSELSKSKCVPLNRLRDIKEKNYLCIGSTIKDNFLTRNTVIWGAGVPNTNIELHIKPKEVRAVRGPISRDTLIKNGVKCPAVYGDPALLLPKYYNPIVEKKYKIGIIPHWSSNLKPYTNLFENENILIIDMKNPEKWTDIIDKILSCEYIVSESLHGLIVAEAYAIPNVWCYISFNNQSIKYHDFFQSIGKDRTKPVTITKNTTYADLIAECEKYERVFNLNLQPLIDACPFKLYFKKDDEPADNSSDML